MPKGHDCRRGSMPKGHDCRRGTMASLPKGHAHRHVAVQHDVHSVARLGLFHDTHACARYLRKKAYSEYSAEGRLG